MDTVKITVTDRFVIAETPYNLDFIAGARGLNGAFNRPGVTPAKTWSFDARDEDRVRQLCRTVFGTDGTPADGPTLTLRLPVVAAYNRKEDSEFRAAGLRLVWRPARDADVRYAPNVVPVSGGFPGSAGSVAYPELAPYEGTVIEVRDLPADVARKVLDTITGATMVDPVADRRAALAAERAQLAERLATVDAELAQLDSQAHTGD